LRWLIVSILSRAIRGFSGIPLDGFLVLAAVLGAIYLASLILLILGIVSHGLSRWLPKILENGGLSPTVAGFAASVPTLVGLPLALILPRVVPPRSRGKVIALMSLIGAVPPLMVVMTHGAPLLVGLTILGAINWAGTPLMMLILMDSPEIGPEYMGAVGGLYFSVSEIGGFLGPSLVGALHDWRGDFILAAAVLVAARLAIAAIALLLRHPEPAAAPAPG
jgi:cyanate permease